MPTTCCKPTNRRSGKGCPEVRGSTTCERWANQIRFIFLKDLKGCRKQWNLHSKKYVQKSVSLDLDSQEEPVSPHVLVGSPSGWGLTGLWGAICVETLPCAGAPVCKSFIRCKSFSVCRSCPVDISARRRLFLASWQGHTEYDPVVSCCFWQHHFLPSPVFLVATCGRLARWGLGELSASANGGLEPPQHCWQHCWLLPSEMKIYEEFRTNKKLQTCRQNRIIEHLL